MKREGSHLDFLDSLRGAAIMMVFLYHSLAAASNHEYVAWNRWCPDFRSAGLKVFYFPFMFGWTGVAVFFVVSGFCIHLGHQRSSRQDMITFFVRRFFRIYPPYFLAVVIFALRYLHNKDHADPVAQVVSHLLLIHNVKLDWFFGINGSFWSIAVEVQLYLLYPALLLFVSRFSWAGALCLVGGVEIGLRALAAGTSFFFGTELPIFVTASPCYYWLSWSIGARAAEAYLRGEPLPFHRVPLWVFPLATLLTGCFNPLQPFCFLCAALSTVSVINLALMTSSARGTSTPSFFSKYLMFVGVVSYSVYLLHQRILVSLGYYLQTHSAGFHVGDFAIFLLCLSSWIPILFVSWCYYRWIELPSIELGKAVLHRLWAVRPAPPDKVLTV